MAVRLAQCSSWHSARPAVSHLCTRSFTCTAHAREQHLLWAGTLLDQASCTHQPLSQDLFLAAGAGDDINAGHITLLEPSASPTRGHALLPYRTATDPPLTRIFAVGRNTFSQLGLGFASQEATFGLVRPGFSGDGGISSLIAAQGQTWIHTLPASDAQSDDQQQPSRLFACGNNTLGQLGLARSNGPSDSFQQPILHLLPAPRQVDAQDDSHIISVAAGLDHSLLLRRISRQDNTGNIIQVCSTGLNADGQLGRRLVQTQSQQDDSASLPPLFDDHYQPVLEEQVDSTTLRQVAKQWNVAAGGDTSFAWTITQSNTEASPTLDRVWAWGNNEYQQCLRPMEDVGDQIQQPLDVTHEVKTVLGPGRTVAQLKLGGSWVAILDDTGRLFTAGFGATGRGTNDDDGAFQGLGQVEGLPPLSLITCSNDALMAVSKCRRRVFVWGIDCNGGLLGLGSHGVEQSDDVIHRVRLPKELDVGKSLGPDGVIQSAALGGDNSWILIEDGQEPLGVWRGSSEMGVIVG